MENKRITGYCFIDYTFFCQEDFNHQRNREKVLYAFDSPNVFLTPDGVNVYEG